jgi:hypothetical protein
MALPEVHLKLVYACFQIEFFAECPVVVTCTASRSSTCLVIDPNPHLVIKRILKPPFTI